MKIGILGFGIVGKSILNFFKNKANSITIWDDRVLSKDELQYVFESNATVSQDITSFLELKVQALKNHGSQKEKLYMQRDAITTRAKFRGFQAKVEMAEAFEACRFLL